jgi:hypothetical protein
VVVALLNFTAGNLIGVYQGYSDVAMEEAMRTVIPDNRQPFIIYLYFIRHINDFLIFQSLFFVNVGNLIVRSDKKLPLNEYAGFLFVFRGFSLCHLCMINYDSPLYNHHGIKVEKLVYSIMLPTLSLSSSSFSVRLKDGRFPVPACVSVKRRAQQRSIDQNASGAWPM